MKFGVVVFPGSNCDYDCYHVLKDIISVEVDFVWHQNFDVSKYDALVLPGGFSYGDYLRPGAIARFSPVMESLISFAEKGKLIIGICNGFQVLLEAGLIPGSLQKNKKLSFICKDVLIKVENNQTPFTNKCTDKQILNIPIAHGEGNYFTDSDTLKELQDNDQIVFRYCDEQGRTMDSNNPNGSIDSIAGICNKKGNVLGMMPHPERAAESLLGSTDGQLLFNSMLSICQFSLDGIR